MLVTTMVAPAGVSSKMERQRPNAEQNTAMTEEEITTDLKLLNNRMDESAGKIISAVINKEPTNLIDKTMTTAVTVAIKRLYTGV